MSYDQFATTFSKSRHNHPWPELDSIIDDIKKQWYRNILDIGCGNGRFLEEGKNRGYTSEGYLGLDSSSGMIEEAKRLHPWYQFEVGDMTHIASLLCHCEDGRDEAIHAQGAPSPHFVREDGMWDAILFLASFHHLESREARLQVLQNTKNLLAKEGHIYLTNWNLWDQPRYESVHRGDGDYDIKIGAYSRYYHGFTLDELAWLFRESGYRIIENRIFAWGRNIVSILTYAD